MAGANGITSKSGGARVVGVASGSGKSMRKPAFPQGTTWAQAASASRSKMRDSSKGMTQFVEGRRRVPVGEKIRL